jgi:hypothetical protein
MDLTCLKCGRRHPMSEEDALSFYPRFRCLSCGETIPVPLTEKEYLDLRWKKEPDPRLPRAGD